MNKKMNKELKTEKLLLEHELLDLAISINQIRDGIAGMTERYGYFLSGAITKRIREMQVEANSIADMLLQSFDDLSTNAVKQKKRYDSFLVNQNSIGYESEKRILLNFPENSEYSGFSVWINQRYFTKSMDGDGYQVRFYPDSIIRIHHYKKQNDEYVAVETKEISGTSLKKGFRSEENNTLAAEDEGWQLDRTSSETDEGIHY